MKNFHKALSILAAAALFAGCSSYDETNDPARAGNTSVKLLADVADDAETRAEVSQPLDGDALAQLASLKEKLEGEKK